MSSAHRFAFDAHSSPSALLPRPAVLEVNLTNLADNYRILKQKAGDAEVAGVVKANAYGLGLAPIAQTLWKAGCRHFFVAQLEGGIDLRQILPDAHIYILTGPLGNESETFHHHNLIPVLNHLGQVYEWRRYLHEVKEKLPAILHVETGMNRLAITEHDWPELFNLIDFPIEYIMSHLACADEPQHILNQRQLNKFTGFIKQLPEHLKDVKKSLANSSGHFLGKDYIFDMTRAGYSLYGGNPTPYKKNPMRPVIKLKARIIQIKDVTPGTPVGYSATYNAPRKSKIATLAVGYADGILRSLNQNGEGQVYLGSQAIPIVGRISMDLINVDVTELRPKVQVGDYLDILNEHQTIDDLAHTAGTIGYEVLTSLGMRYDRVYIEEEEGTVQ